MPMLAPRLKTSSSTIERSCMEDYFTVYCGIDVGKWSHHAVALEPTSGEVLFNGKVGQSEKEIRDLLTPLLEVGQTIVVVDEPGPMSALLFAVSRDEGASIGFITSKTMARAIDMYGGDVKTDAHDAMVIAEIASGLPKLVKQVDEKTPERHYLSTLMSYDRELTLTMTRSANRLHALLLSICPALETLMQGKRIQGLFNLAMLQRYGGPRGLRKAGRGNIHRWVRSRKGFGCAALLRADEMLAAALSQSVTLPGTEDIEELIKMEAQSLSSALGSRKSVAEKRDKTLKLLPEANILMSLPGVGAITCATFIAEVGDVTKFSSAAKLAAYAGLAPKVRKSGKSVNSVTKPRGGNRRLKRVLVLSASKSILSCEESRRYYDKKRSEGKCYASAVVALARKRVDVMYAMLRNGKAYQKKNG